MSYARELLTLANRQNLEDTEAERRRCVSTVYYAIFHRLIEVALEKFVPSGDVYIQNMFRRAPTHTNLKEMCHSLAEFVDPSHRKPSRIPESWKSAGYPHTNVNDEVKELAISILELHKWREIADYDLKTPIPGIEAVNLREKATELFDMIDRGLPEPQWSLFLASFLMKERR